MENNALIYHCPECMAYLRHDGKEGKWVCDYCDSKFTMAELEARGALAKEDDYEVKNPEEADDNISEIEFHFEENLEGIDGDVSDMTAYSCPSCGAEIVTDGVTAATFCVFCGNPTVIPQQLTGEFRPSAIVPFETNKEDAKNAFLNLCKGKKLLPKDYTSKQRLEQITGVYVPFWLFDCKADFDYHATGENALTWSDSRYIYTKHDLYHIHRTGTLDFENIPLDASANMNDALMDALEPFHLDKKEPFSMSYLSGYQAEKYTYQPKELYERMTERINEGVERLAADGTGHYHSVYGVKCHTDYTSDKQTYMLLPVWMLNSKFEGKNYLFAMNGQTGKIVGELPVDKKQVRKLFWKIFAISFPVFAVISLLFGGVIG